MSRPLLILRPEPGASATAARAVAMGLEIFVCPLFEVRAVEWKAPAATKFDAILLTSANAVRFGGCGLADYYDLPVFAVGQATGETAREAGFTDITAGSSDVGASIASIAAAGCSNVLHLAGRDRTAVDAAPVRIETVVVYTSDILPSPDIPEKSVALLHSVRAAQRFAEVAPHRASTAIVAISSKVADIVGSGWQSILVAGMPQDAAMLALAASLCETQAE